MSFPGLIFGIIIIGGPLGCIGGANKSGWMNEDLYVNFIKKVPQVVGYVPVFIINKTDIATFQRNDVIAKLPEPVKNTGSTRKCNQFPVDITHLVELIF